MLVVAGLSLKNLQPEVWKADSPFFLPKLRAIMVSYADFHRSAAMRRAAMKDGLRAYLGAAPDVQVYLDNGSFYFIDRKRPDHFAEYERFVRAAKPDWWPIPQDFIPIPNMTARKQRDCFHRTMAVNQQYRDDGFVPVVHIGRQLDNYIAAVKADERLSAKPRIALGGIVPNLLRASNALPYEKVLAGLRAMRRSFGEHQVHVFGVGGTATLHLAATLKFDSVDSSGWRNRAARGIVQLPGSGDRLAAELGSWRGRRPSPAEWERLGLCACPACVRHGVNGLRERGIKGFANRASHNLWVLLEEAEWLSNQMAAGTYRSCYEERLDNSTYVRLIRRALED